MPNGNVISEVGKNESLKTAVTTKSNNMALVYFSNNSHCQVTNILNNDAEAYWFYPRNGEKENVSLFKENESRIMAPPSKWEDAILILQIQE
ncbi:putative collagen-binding domain-containing protein [Thalassobellus suaedae]|uniref:Collagen-binding domain-containing protein n=1 Tax=Thalassobellus suaedae TaxID=3074124 RepID=A0ABY9XYB6_9FLAO|nr:putative collagen-binding domain-containing protein [Flavobacteriaceae bacterium HL-DH14]